VRRWNELRYVEGLAVAVTIVVGGVMVIYGLGIPFLNLVQAVGLLLLVVGAYTLASASRAGAEMAFFAVWGVLLVLAGVSLIASPFVSPLVPTGLILISIGLLTAIIVSRRKR